jgi:RecA/RadA recombinase
MSLDVERKKNIEKLLKKFKKDHAIEEDSKIGFLSDNNTIGVIEHLPTDIIGMDVLTNGGLIKGKPNLIYGGENTGKSTMMLMIIAANQKRDPDFIAAICDNEKVFDRSYAEYLGVDPERLIVGADFKSAEQAYDFCNEIAESNLINFLVVDTIQALASHGEMYTAKGASRSTQDNTMALIPRLLSQFLRMYTSQTRGDTTLVLLSQVRLDLGSFMPSAKKTGGKAIDHYNVLNLKLASTKAHSGSEASGTKWPWTIGTEKDAPPKSFTLKMKIDKAKMQGRYDGNVLTMYFHQGEFDRKLNVLAIAKSLGLHDGKTLKYQAVNPDEEMQELELKAKGFRDMYNRVPDEAIAWLEPQLIEKYTEQVSFHKEEVEDEPSREEE